MKKVIFFRGRNTDGIIADAKAFGIVGDGDKCYVICREGDALAQPGDMTPDQFRNDLFIHDDDNFIIIANGGTTKQLVPVVVRFAGFSAVQDEQDAQAFYEGLRNDHRGWTWKVLDVQRDGVEQIGGDK